MEKDNISLAEQKANELMKAAYNYVHANLFSFREESHNNNCIRVSNIVCDEVLKEVNRLDKKFNLGLEGTKEFWNEVKQSLKGKMK